MSPRQTQTAPRKTQEYSVSACVPGDLSDVELATCVEIVSDGVVLRCDGTVHPRRRYLDQLAKARGARVLTWSREGIGRGVGAIFPDSLAPVR
jgi:hypothetical protein